MTPSWFVSADRVTSTAGRLDRVDALFDRWSRSGQIRAASYSVGRAGGMIAPRCFGTVRSGAGRPVGPDTPFLVASLTKPLVAMAALILAERGELTLDDRLADHVPEFQGDRKEEVRLRHLLTHTSGLPDQLPENQSLRAGHRPLADFVLATCRTPLLFEPGTAVRYQSMGTLMLAEVIRRLSSRPLPEFLRETILGPLAMADSALGCPAAWLDRVAEVTLGPESAATDWHWNTPYWLGLGSPWGGMVSTAADLGRVCRLMLGLGEVDATRVISPASARAMMANQLDAMPGIPEVDRRCRPWGLGWRLNWPGTPTSFGDLLGPGAVGHWGATGTLCWIDPGADAFAVILTSRPHGEPGGHLLRASNAIAAALA